VHYYKRHLGDFAKSLSNLSQGQIGAYDLLLDWHYANEKPLPLDIEELYIIGRCRSKCERDNVDRVLRYFDRTYDGYVQKRAIEEIERAAARGETNRRIALEREEARKVARTEHESCSERATNLQPIHKPLATKEQKQEQEQKLTSTPAGDDQCGLGFDDFWSAYPSKDGKKPARLKWEQKKLDRIAGRIVDDVLRRSREHGKWLDGYIPNATTYLNQERWNDPIQPRSGAPPPRHAPSKTRQAISDILGVTEHEQSPEYQQLTASLV
jgi:uncharacterized protein YdaU (DUF1376 family)